MRKNRKVHLIDLLVDQLFPVVFSDTLNLCVELDVLTNCQIVKNRIELGTVSD